MPTHLSFRFAPPTRRFLPGWAAATVTAAAAVLTSAAPLTAAPPEGSPSPTPAVATPAAAPTGQQQASATELVGTMRRAIGLITRAQGTKAAEAPFRTAKARAFARAVAAAAAQVDALDAALRSPDARTFDAMARTGSALAALQVTFRYNGIEDDDVEEGFEKLAAAYNVFRRNFGRDLVAARSESESALAPAQRAARDDLQKHGADLTKVLATLQPALKDNPAAAFEIAAILKGLTRVDRVPRDRRAFLNHLAAAELFLGRRAGLGFYLGDVFPADAKKLEAAAPAEFQAYGEAFRRAQAAALADVKPGELFARPAPYFEDLGVSGVTDAELPPLLGALGKAAAANEAKPDLAAARAADAQINADDPDDDSSLDATGTDADPAAPDAGND